MNHWIVATASCRSACAFALASAALFSSSGCSSPDKGGGTVNPNGASGASSAGGAPSAGGASANGANAGSISLGNVGQEPAGPGGPCQGLACAVPDCVGMPKTTITGKVYDPAGKVPLYNVLVYVPNAPLEPFTDGAACDRCNAKVLNPVTSAITDEQGSFVLQDAPAGQSVPLVIQVGKWRRQITVPNVTACADTPMLDPQVMRLPRNKSEGDIPRIAISAGAADQMECLPLRMGIDPAEFTNASGDGRIHLFTGHHGNGPNAGLPLTQLDAGAMLSSSDELWSTVDSLMKYDIVILSCEGGSYEQQKPMGMRQALYDYESKGGRVFASHWHNVWFEQGPDPVPTTGTWQTRMPNPAGNMMDREGDDTPQLATINQTFPKGEALAKWLLNVGASTTQGSMDVVYPRDDIQAVNPTLAREWITVNNPNFPDAPKAVQYMSFNTPIGAPDDQICGRAVFTDLHVASVDNRTGGAGKPFPSACEQREMSAQEKAVAFMLFDLSACVQNEDVAPKPPK